MLTILVRKGNSLEQRRPKELISTEVCQIILEGGDADLLNVNAEDVNIEMSNDNQKCHYMLPGDVFARVKNVILCCRVMFSHVSKMSQYYWW